MTAVPTNARRRYWLMKSEPDAFSIDDLHRVGTEPWTGVRNYQARNNMRAMQVGDGVLFYHSSCDVPGIVGVATVAKDGTESPVVFPGAAGSFGGYCGAWAMSTTSRGGAPGMARR